jgi:arabinofuranan 3-O-arabinosyltransferase
MTLFSASNPAATRLSKSRTVHLCVGVFALLALAVYGFPLIDLMGGLLGFGLTPMVVDRDFANYYAAAHLAATGEQHLLFSQPIYHAHLEELFGVGYPLRAWSYPPHFLLMIWPLGWLGYKAGLIAFLSATFALFAAATVTFRRYFAPQSNAVVLSVVLATFVLLTIYTTQNGFLTGAALLFGFAWMKPRPVLAGLAFACLTIKPQLGFLIPVLLVLDRNWRAFASTAVFTVLLLILSVAVFGWDSWRAYLTETLVYQRSVMTDWNGIFLRMMPSTFASARSLGFTPSFAAAVQWPISISAAAAVLWLLRKETDPLRRVFVVACGTFLITPYAFNYDMGALMAVAAMFVASDRLPAARLGVVIIAVVAMLPPMITNLGRANLPLSPLILAAGLAVLVGERRRPVKAVQLSPA